MAALLIFSPLILLALGFMTIMLLEYRSHVRTTNYRNAAVLVDDSERPHKYITSGEM